MCETCCCCLGKGLAEALGMQDAPEGPQEATETL